MISDEIFNEKMLEAIEAMTEQEELDEAGGGITAPGQKKIQRERSKAGAVPKPGETGSATRAPGPEAAATAPGPTAAPGTGTPQPEYDSEMAGAPVDQNFSFSYLDTHDMFYKNPPAGSDTWPSSDKKIYKPLQTGVIVKDLIKFLESKSKKRWKYISKLGIGAAKYSDYQFRIRIGSKLKMDCTVKFVVTRETAKAVLERLEVNTPFQGANAVFEKSTLKRLDTIELKKINSSKTFKRLRGAVGFREGAQGKSTTEIPKMIEVAKNRLKNIEGIEKEVRDKATDLVDHIVQYASDKEAEYNVDFNPKDPDHINKLVSIAQKIIDDKIEDESKAIQMLIDSGFIVTGEETEEEEVDANESYSVNMNDYLKKILLEADGEARRKQREKDPSRETLEKDVGGDLVLALDNNIEKWFKNRHGITAFGSAPVFEGKIFEFFQATEVDFRAQERTIETEEQSSDKVVVRLKGYIEAIGYTWLDARIREVGGWNTWTFRIHDNPRTPFYRGTARIRGGGAGLIRTHKNLYGGKDAKGAQFGYRDDQEGPKPLGNKERTFGKI